MAKSLLSKDQEATSTWDALRNWLPTVVTIISIVGAVGALGVRYDSRIDRNLEVSAKNKDDIEKIRAIDFPKVKDSQVAVKVQLEHIQTTQAEQGKRLDNIDRKVDKLLDKLLNGTRRGVTGQ